MSKKIITEKYKITKPKYYIGAEVVIKAFDSEDVVTSIIDNRYFNGNIWIYSFCKKNNSIWNKINPTIELTTVEESKIICMVKDLK